MFLHGRTMEAMMSESDKLREEAKSLLQCAFKIPKNCAGETIDRIVDCIIGAAVIESALLQGQALKTIQKVYGK